MEVGFIGLGRMGSNMVRRLLSEGHRVIVWNRSVTRIQELVAEGAHGTYSIPEFISHLQSPHVVWLMVPAGQPTDEMVTQVAPLLTKGDILIDGSNSHHKDSMLRGQQLARQGIHFLDVGIAGGIWGLKDGYSMMVGGELTAVTYIEPLLKTLAPTDGYLHCGPSGAGHYVKMVHNGIEYGLMQIYGEGFELLKASPFDLDLQAVAHAWNHGSIIRSWLLELAEQAFNRDTNLAHIRGYVEDSGVSRRAVQQAMDTDVPIPMIALALMERFRSRQDDSFQDKVVAALRREFGGHTVKYSTK